MNDRAAQVDESQSEDKSTGILMCVHLKDIQLYHTERHSESMLVGVWSEDCGQM